VDVNVEHLVRSTEGCIWLLGVERFHPDVERLVQRIKTSNPDVRIVVFAASNDPSDIVRALNAGVSGFLCQNIPSGQLLKSLELVLLGETIIYPHYQPMARRGTRRQGEANDAMSAGDEPVNTASYPIARLNSGEAIGELTAEQSSSDNSAAGNAKGLSRREILILRTLMDGASNKVIARKLVITEATVKVHMKAILRKLRLQNRTQAAIWARNYLSEIRP
jgi:two-component system nitrate/nitrite response regulator NarL